jgi:hypothetical protein
MNINVKMFTLLHNCEIFCFYILSRGIIHIFSESKRIVIPDKVIKIKSTNQYCKITERDHRVDHRTEFVIKS